MASPDSSTHPGRLTRWAVATWLFVFIVAECLRLKFLQSGPPHDAAELLAAVTVLDAAQVAFIVAAIRRSSDTVSLNLSHAIAALAFLVLFAIILGAHPAVPALAIGSYALWLCWSGPARSVGAALSLFVIQYVLPGWPFLTLHAAFARLDAAVIRSLLRLFGEKVAGADTFIVLPQKMYGVDVLWGCATSTTLVSVIPSLMVILLSWKGQITRRDRWYAAGLAALIFPLNWLRLLLICAGPKHYHYWHSGGGAALFGMLYAAIVFAVGWLAVRQGRGEPAR